MKAPSAAAAATTLALAAAVFLVLAAPSDARPRRSLAAVAEFRQLSPCPVTGKPAGACPGYVVDYVVPPCAEGENSPDNLRWLTLTQARDNGNWEREYCRFHRARLRAESALPLYASAR
ncbi:HNH endonuclease [Roseateles saccharophilus]|uniref:HNH endonuclease n=1 Tax=Roseateles saccharophilus TaxID=304 RepID=A0A4R3UI85_ROSSA|nr:HNH endonuclease [Roseateles saccharophilus]TCU88363.1 hypothetical protein EV671_104034 [Roseateles saccharophilus]